MRWRQTPTRSSRSWAVEDGVAQRLPARCRVRAAPRRPHGEAAGHRVATGSGLLAGELRGWFEEPPDWMAERTANHQAIRDDLVRSSERAGTCDPDARRAAISSATAGACAATAWIRACVTRSGFGHRHAGHRVQSRCDRQHSPQLLAESRRGREGRRAHAQMIARYRTV